MDKLSSPSPLSSSLPSYSTLPSSSIPFIRTPFNYDTDSVSLHTGLSCPDPTLAQQSFKDECDINTIMRRFGQGAELPDNFRSPQYGDFDQVADYQTALNAVRQADEAFMSMPAELRARFHNQPQELLDFLADGTNQAEARKLGLLQPLPEAAAAPLPPST